MGNLGHQMSMGIMKMENIHVEETFLDSVLVTSQTSISIRLYTKNQVAETLPIVLTNLT